MKEGEKRNPGFWHMKVTYTMGKKKKKKKTQLTIKNFLAGRIIKFRNFSKYFLKINFQFLKSHLYNL